MPSGILFKQRGEKMNFKEYQVKAGTTAQYPNIAELTKSIARDVVERLFPGQGATAKISDYLDCIAGRPEFNNPYYPALGLAGEVGEYCNKLKKVMRDNDGLIDDKFIEFAKGELGDILWYLSQCCSELDLSLNDVAEANIQKLASRKERGVITGNGDLR
jgi:NTP pyrophosphatase (non-canonical NTP hydrolase)